MQFTDFLISLVYANEISRTSENEAVELESGDARDAHEAHDAQTSDKHKLDMIVEKNDVCVDCGTLLQRKNVNTCICPDCGLEVHDEIYTDCFTNNINKPSFEGGLPFKIIGLGESAKALSNRIRCSSSSYAATRRKKMINHLLKKIYNVGSNQETIPMFIIEEVVDTFLKLQTKRQFVKRAGGLDAVFAALVNSACIKHNIARKHKTIVAALGVGENQISLGHKMLREFQREGSIELYEGYGEDIDYINQYFEKLGLGKWESYKDFVIELIKETRVDKIKDPRNNSRPTTRIAGAIYIMCENLGITTVNKDRVVSECSLSKSTITRYVNLVQTYIKKPEVAAVFTKYEVPIRGAASNSRAAAAVAVA